MKHHYILLPFLLFTVFLTAQNSQWKALEAEGEPLARHENALVAVGNKLILIGGRGEKPVDIFDMEEKKWSRGAQPPFEIHHMQAVSLDGLVYILGGFTGSWPHETPLTHVLVYDVAENFWSIGDEIPKDRRRGAAGAVDYNNKIYLVNGIINGHTSGWVNWLDEYDPYSGEWKILPNAPVARDHFQTAVIDDKLYVAGGRRSGSAESGFAGTVSETNVYDFNTNSWQVLADIPTPRAGTAAAVHNGHFVVIGGESDVQEKAHNEVEALDPKTNAWKTLTPLTVGRHGTQTVYFNDNILIGAGSGNRGGGPELTSFEVLSTSEDIDPDPETIGEDNLQLSATELNFGKGKDSQELRIKNSGKKAVFLSYLQIDNSENFQLDLQEDSSIILGPEQILKIQISAAGEERATSAKLFIKKLGNSEPLVVELSN